MLAIVHCREPKTGQQKAQFYYEDDSLCPPIVILFTVSMAIAKKNLLVTIFLAKIIIKIYTVIYSLEENGLIRKAIKSS